MQQRVPSIFHVRFHWVEGSRRSSAYWYLCRLWTCNACYLPQKAYTWRYVFRCERRNRMTSRCQSNVHETRDYSRSNGKENWPNQVGREEWDERADIWWKMVRGVDTKASLFISELNIVITNTTDWLILTIVFHFRKRGSCVVFCTARPWMLDVLKNDLTF